MIRTEARALVLDVIASVAPDVDAGTCRDDSRLHDDLGLDSMDALEVVERVAERCGVRVPERDFCVLETLGSFADYVADATAA